MKKNDLQHIKVLYLVRWYPNRYDPMPGLFIQRHAEAAAHCARVGVVYTHVAEGEKIRGFETEYKVINGVPTAKVYYSNDNVKVPVIAPFVNAVRFFHAHIIGIKKIKRELGGFDVVHVHVLTRLGLIALWYKWTHNKPYVISEHWSRYLPLTGDFRGALRKWFTRLVVKNASVVTTVTQNLAVAMQNHGLRNSDYRVLANVVVNDFMNYSLRPGGKKEKALFVHVSCFEDKSKNISGLLRVISSLSKKRNDFVFKLIGEGMDLDQMKNYARDLEITEDCVLFTGLLEGEKLVREMADADMLVVFSHYENLPVVINESFALGVPVIATRVGGIPEYVNKANGCLLDAGDEDMLEKYLTEYLEGKLTFDREKIKNRARTNFSPKRLGDELCTMYRNLV